jgi:mannosyltransferase OCH1-like enzyme
MRIPKLIHYVWVGPRPMGRLENGCIESWKKYFPEYELVHWDEKNIVIDNQYLETAFKNKKWSNISNYVRLTALKDFGGIYFDTDFEVIKRFDFLEDVNCFIGFESPKNDYLNNAIMGSVKDHRYINDCLTLLIKNYNGLEMANLSSPFLATEVLKTYGNIKNTNMKINDVNLYNSDFFSPYDWDDTFLFTDIKCNTYGIHHWQSSWLRDELEQEKESLQYFKNNIINGNVGMKLAILYFLRALRKSFLINVIKRIKLLGKWNFGKD